jgi:hypothetical protein
MDFVENLPPLDFLLLLVVLVELPRPSSNINMIGGIIHSWSGSPEVLHVYYTFIMILKTLGTHLLGILWNTLGV